MPKYVVLSTLTMTRFSVELGSRGSVRLMTLPAEDAGEFVKSLR